MKVEREETVTSIESVLQIGAETAQNLENKTLELLKLVANNPNIQEKTGWVAKLRETNNYNQYQYNYLDVGHMALRRDGAITGPKGEALASGTEFPPKNKDQFSHFYLNGGADYKIDYSFGYSKRSGLSGRIAEDDIIWYWRFNLSDNSLGLTASNDLRFAMVIFFNKASFSSDYDPVINLNKDSIEVSKGLNSRKEKINFEDIPSWYLRQGFKITDVTEKEKNIINWLETIPGMLDLRKLYSKIQEKAGSDLEVLNLVAKNPSLGRFNALRRSIGL